MQLRLVQATYDPIVLTESITVYLLNDLAICLQYRISQVADAIAHGQGEEAAKTYQ